MRDSTIQKFGLILSKHYYLNTGILYFSVLVIVFSSCLPVEKVAYLQNDQYEIKDLPVNEVVGNYKEKIKNYLIAPKDVLSIRVVSLTAEEYNLWADTKTSNDVSPLVDGHAVNDSGKVKLPLVGSISIAGLTIEQAEQRIQDALTSYLREPTVNLKLLSFQFTVLGEVKNPGIYTNYGEKINMFEALGYAGDMTDFGNRSKVQLLRNLDGQLNVVYVNLLEEDFINSPYFYVQPHDLITVLPTNLKNFKRYQLANFGIILSTLTAITIMVTR